MAFSQRQALALKPLLDQFLNESRQVERIAFDPIEFPHRYKHPRDVEVAALLSAALAYGRVDLFKPKIEGLLSQMGASPAEYVAALTMPRAVKLLDGFVYRFNLPADIAVLLFGMKHALRTHGSLEGLFLSGLVADEDGAWHRALAHFTASLRDVDEKAIKRALGPTRGLGHLLPTPLGPGAAKRLNLYLRWMVRGPDEVDFGVWKKISPSRLLIPLDTHIGRIAKHLQLTKRSDLSWRTAEEITAALRLIDPLDPVKYDFALCHYGMSGRCPTVTRAEACESCLMLAACKTGKRRTR
jgi:uncharacterized protein (TIGR02757 family)